MDDKARIEGFYQDTRQLIESIEDCFEKRRLLPCLTLLYAGIDIFASLECQPHEGIQAAFVRWADRYLLKAHSLPCTALEIYAARCGIIHTFTADSDLSRKGQVRKIFYAWGTARAEDLQETSNILNRSDCVAVHIRDIIDAFRCGLADYLDEVAREPERQQIVERRAGLWFVQIDQDIVKKIVEFYKNDSAT